MANRFTDGHRYDENEEAKVIFKRSLRLAHLSRSAFLFGPRMTGKTFLLRELPADLYIDLLDPELELQLKQTPRLFWEQISALSATMSRRIRQSLSGGKRASLFLHF